MELRAPDGAASPYMVIGGFGRAGLEGIRAKLPLPPALDKDPRAHRRGARRAWRRAAVEPVEAAWTLDADPVAKARLRR